MNTLAIPDKIDFFISLIKKDMDHYMKQQEQIKEWIQSSRPLLNDTETALLEELFEEYQTKSCIQNETMKEFQKTLFYNKF